MENVIVDCRTGGIQRVPLSADDLADHQQRQQAVLAEAAAQAAAEAQRQADHAVVRARASADPAFAALVRLLGLS